jgi:hypothetical protein
LKTKIACETLSPDALGIEVYEVIRMIEKIASGELSVMYGWAYNVPDQYEWIRCPAQEFKSFLDDSAAMGVFAHGKGDLWIKLSDPEIEILFCHESDIHLTGDSDEFLITYFRERWLEQGIRVWQQDDGEKVWKEARSSV